MVSTCTNNLVKEADMFPNESLENLVLLEESCRRTEVTNLFRELVQLNRDEYQRCECNSDKEEVSMSIVTTFLDHHFQFFLRKEDGFLHWLDKNEAISATSQLLQETPSTRLSPNASRCIADTSIIQHQFATGSFPGYHGSAPFNASTSRVSTDSVNLLPSSIEFESYPSSSTQREQDRIDELGYDVCSMPPDDSSVEEFLKIIHSDRKRRYTTSTATTPLDIHGNHYCNSSSYHVADDCSGHDIMAIQDKLSIFTSTSTTQNQEFDDGIDLDASEQETPAKKYKMSTDDVKRCSSPFPDHVNFFFEDIKDDSATAKTLETLDYQSQHHVIRQSSIEADDARENDSLKFGNEGILNSQHEENVLDRGFGSDEIEIKNNGDGGPTNTDNLGFQPEHCFNLSVQDLEDLLYGNSDDNCLFFNDIEADLVLINQETTIEEESLDM